MEKIKNKNRPNVLILFADQQRYDTVAAAGYPHMITPNLDKLASEGCLFERAYTSNPVCMPARHDLLTGLPGRAHGYYANAGIAIKDYALPTIPRIFSEAGYRTAAVGKMHFCPDRMHHGYNEMFLMEELPPCRQNDQYAMYLKEQGLEDIQNIHGLRPHIYHTPQTSIMQKEHHGSAWVANRTIEWLEENGENPFFLFAGWIQPHPPFNIPKEYQDMYKDREIPKAVPISRSENDVQEANPWFGDMDSDEEKRRIREAYYTAVSMVDENVGRIIEYLRSEGKIDNTLIIYTSDHGEMLQDKGYYSKEIPYEGSTHIPMIIRYPASVKAGTKSGEFVSLLDILPTCLEACGIKYPEYKYQLPGRSMLNLDYVEKREVQISVTGKHSGRWVMARDERYKYIYFYRNGIEELYDLENDPGEEVNLMKTGNCPLEVYEKLKKEVIDWEMKWGPEENIDEKGLKKFIADGFIEPSERGKHHWWANMQFQYFYDKQGKERGDRYKAELEKALSNREFSGVAMEDTFLEDEWVEGFTENWVKYTGGKVIPKFMKK